MQLNREVRDHNVKVNRVVINQTSIVFPSYASDHFPPIRPWVRNRPELVSREATFFASIVIWHPNPHSGINISKNYQTKKVVKSTEKCI